LKILNIINSANYFIKNKKPCLIYLDFVLPLLKSKQIMNKVNNYGIQLGDKVSRFKRGVPIIRHYAVYLGTDEYGRHIFAENNVNNGVQIVLAEVFFFNTELIRVESVSKSWEQRNRSVKFAKQKVGHNYNLINYNCEHFANEVTSGIKKSVQVSFGFGLAMLFLGGLVIKNNSN
jgi:hypothetical protein